jgi:hypothetical protein
MTIPSKFGSNWATGSRQDFFFFFLKPGGLNMYKNEKQFQIEKKNYRNRGNIDTPNTLYMPTHFPGLVQALQ